MIIMPCFFKTFSYENENEKTINLKKRSEKMGGENVGSLGLVQYAFKNGNTHNASNVSPGSQVMLFDWCHKAYQ